MRKSDTSRFGVEPPARPGEGVVLGMSGGVDSSTAALLLRDAGYAVVGVTFRFHCHGCGGCGLAEDPHHLFVDDLGGVLAEAAGLGHLFHYWKFSHAVHGLAQVRAEFAEFGGMLAELGIDGGDLETTLLADLTSFGGSRGAVVV